ncbi:MAG: hypothetical protein ACWGSD_01785 [Thermodesulfobacteriota bacterium]
MIHDEHPHPPPDGDPQPTAYALQGTLTLPNPWLEAALRSGVEAFLAELTCALREKGCTLIGHIKGMLETGDKGHLFFSVTSFEQRPRFKGELSGEYEKIDLTLNVIVYGVGSDAIEQFVADGLRKHLGEWEN